MNDSPSKIIVDFLNTLIECQPDISKVFKGGVEASQDFIDSKLLHTRLCNDGKRYITTTGIISRIGKLLGDEIYSKYDANDPEYPVVGFILSSESNEPAVEGSEEETE